MPQKTLECGCTLDTDFVSEEHDAKGPPYHKALGGTPLAQPPAESMNEFEAEARKVNPEEWKDALSTDEKPHHRKK